MPFPSEDVMQKALWLLDEGRVHALPPSWDLPPDVSGVMVQGSLEVHKVYAHRDGFQCSCRASADHTWTEPRCSHVLAAMVYWAEAQPPPTPAEPLERRSDVRDAKPAARVRLPGADWHYRIGTKDWWRCRLCGTNYHWSGFSAHHLVKRSQGGDDIVENGVYLCGSGTTGCHGKVEAGARYTRHRLRLVMSYDEVEYCINKKSIDWLETQYPSRPVRV